MAKKLKKPQKDKKTGDKLIDTIVGGFTSNSPAAWTFKLGKKIWDVSSAPFKKGKKKKK